MINANFSAWSIRQPIPAFVLFAVLLALGAVSFSGMSVTKFPNIDVPVIAVTVTQSGAAPSELRSQVTKKIEDAVASITGVKTTSSTVSDGASTTAIEFRLETNTDRALNDVKDEIAKIRADLPRSIDEPIISRIDVEGGAIIIYTLQAKNMTLEELSWFADDTVKRDLQSLKGVGRVERYGGVNREIQVKLDPDRLMALGITASDVNQQLRATNADLAGGRGEIGGKEQSIRTLASAKTLNDLANTKISIPGGREVRLSEVGQVIDGSEEERYFARRDGDPAVALAVFRAKGASEVSVARVVEKKIEELSKQYPDVRLSITDDQVAYTFGNYEAAMGTLLEGAALAVIIVLIFLRDWRATLITAVALPLSIIPTYWLMEMMGFSLNLVSLLALTLATGILVDDAIVEIENIVRHMRMGKSAYRASIEAADEIGLAVIAITFTIVAVFAPVSFMGGIAGQYFKQFGLTVAVSVLISLLVARLITPVLAAYFLSSSSAAHDHEHEGWMTRAYASFLKFTLRHKMLSVLAGVGLFYASLQMLPLLPTGFIPEEDSGRISLSVELPPGSTLGDTRAATDEMSQRIRTIPEVLSVFTLGGAGAKGAGEVRNALMIIRLSNKSKRTIKQKQIEAKINALIADVPDVRVSTSNDRGDRAMSVTVTGNEPEALAQGVAQLEAAMRRLPDFINVSASSGLDRPEIRVSPRTEEAARLGIAPEQIADMVRVATLGDAGPNLAKFNAGDRQIPIRVQIDTGARGDLSAIKALRIRTGAGGSVPLSEVADLSFGNGPSTIERYNRVDRVVIGADLASGVELGEATALIDGLPETKTLPTGVALLQTGDAEVMGEVFSGFAKAMGLGLLIVFGLLVLLFGNLFHPMTILLSLPLAAGGVFGSLLLTNNAISMPVVIGILMLIGIVTKNAILLVDFAVERVHAGVPRFDAIVDAGRKRARPIIMTTVAMVGGMVPTALGHGDGGEFRAPMAIAVIGGLIVSTVLSLVFVPSLYLVMEMISGFFGWMLRGMVNKSDEAPDAAGAALLATPSVAVAQALPAAPAAAPVAGAVHQHDRVAA
jgi:hydrophobic/amphiphilic exporter-1 (mainly G- bacteria), HAE1 family